MESEHPPSIRTKRRSLVRGLVKTIRPHQWVKNLFVLAPMVFHKDLVSTTAQGDAALNLRVTGQALMGTLVFCLLAGAVYTINDLVDVEADRVHPVKRFRPIANGDVPEALARLFAAGLVVASLAIGFLQLNWKFGAVAALYFVENIAYSFKLKKVAFLDVGMIAFGFVLRVLAGGFATSTQVSWYMIACTALLALFLGFGKRRHELEGEHAGKQRAALVFHDEVRAWQRIEELRELTFFVGHEVLGHVAAQQTETRLAVRDSVRADDVRAAQNDHSNPRVETNADIPPTAPASRSVPATCSLIGKPANACMATLRPRRSPSRFCATV